MKVNFCIYLINRMISDWVIIDYSKDFANEINKLLDNIVILNPFRLSHHLFRCNIVTMEPLTCSFIN